MLRWRWDKQYPEINHISKQTLRDNAARFKIRLEKNIGSEMTRIQIEQDTQIKQYKKVSKQDNVNLLRTGKR